MKFTDIGIIISQKSYSENSAIVKIFTQNHGIYCGFVSAPKSKKNQAIFQIGNLISFEWRSRNEEGLGHFYYPDLIKSFAAQIIFDRLKLSCCSSLFYIIESCFLERENHHNLFVKIHDFLLKISQDQEAKKSFIGDYIKIELKILKTLGYGIDLSSCVVTNSTTDLVFVSPKSARAVSLEIGKPYANLLLKLPPFLLTDPAENDDIENAHLFDGLKLSGYFLEKFVFAEQKLRPSSRSSIEAALRSCL
ncbi:MAG: DNA repair protein RecO [Rickettsiales bacterium]|nr:DNA repair protein RecO [Rickettsiales bacterium]